MYRKGIEVLKRDAEGYKVGGREDDCALAIRQVASAYASIAELFMTDLCDEPNAEQSCETALKEALSVDSNNVDALQSLANLRMIRDKDAEAKVHLTKVFDIVMELNGKKNAPE